MKRYFLSDNYYIFMAEVGAICTAIAVAVGSMIPITFIFAISLLVLERDLKDIDN